MTIDTEIAFYKANRKDFVAQHKDKYLIIKGEALVGVFDTRSQAQDAAMVNYPAGGYIIERPTGVIKN